MLEKLLLMARLAGPVASLQALKSKAEAAKQNEDWGKCADIINEAMPLLLKMRDELRAASGKKKASREGG